MQIEHAGDGLGGLGGRGCLNGRDLLLELGDEAILHGFTTLFHLDEGDMNAYCLLRLVGQRTQS